jgi:hypothetical protein
MKNTSNLTSTAIVLGRVTYGIDMISSSLLVVTCLSPGGLYFFDISNEGSPQLISGSPFFTSSVIGYPRSLQEYPILIGGNGATLTIMVYNPCYSDSDCTDSSKPYCNPSHFCVECYEDSQCEKPDVCKVYKCVSDGSTTYQTIGTIVSTAGSTITYSNQAAKLLDSSSSTAVTRPLFINMFLYLRYLDIKYPTKLNYLFASNSEAL